MIFKSSFIVCLDTKISKNFFSFNDIFILWCEIVEVILQLLFFSMLENLKLCSIKLHVVSFAPVINFIYFLLEVLNVFFLPNDSTDSGVISKKADKTVVDIIAKIVDDDQEE